MARSPENRLTLEFGARAFWRRDSAGLGRQRPTTFGGRTFWEVSQFALRSPGSHGAGEGHDRPGGVLEAVGCGWEQKMAVPAGCHLLGLGEGRKEGGEGREPDGNLYGL